MLGFSAVAVAWTSFTGTAYAADPTPSAPPAASSAVAPASSAADPLAELTSNLGSLLGATTATVGNVLTTVTTASTVASPPPTTPAVPTTSATSTHAAAQQQGPDIAAPSTTPQPETAPTDTSAPAAPASDPAGEASATTDVPVAPPLLGHTTKDVTTALTGAVVTTVDQTAAPAADLLKSLLDASPVPTLIDSTPIVSTTVHGLVATSAKAVDTVTGLVDHGVSPTLGLLGIGVAPVQDTVDDIVMPVVTPLSSQTTGRATPVRAASDLPLGPPTTAPPGSPSVTTSPAAPPNSSATPLHTPRASRPTLSSAVPGLSPAGAAANTATRAVTGTPSVATIDVADLLGTPGTGAPDQPSSDVPAPVSTGGPGAAAPVVGTASTEVTARSLVGTSPRDHAWRLPVAPAREPGARPD